MNVYDFDNTIYDGESIVDFYFFLLFRNPSLIYILPKLVLMLVKYKACKISYDELLQQAEKYIKKLAKYFSKALVKEFWDKNSHKIKKFYIENQREDDVILSASCGFLIREICSRFGIKNVVASEVDLTLGKIQRVCYRDKKPEIFKEEFTDAEIDEFYTDSLNDEPMFALAKRVFLVKGNNVKELML